MCIPHESRINTHQTSDAGIGAVGKQQLHDVGAAFIAGPHESRPPALERGMGREGAQTGVLLQAHRPDAAPRNTCLHTTDCDSNTTRFLIPSVPGNPRGHSKACTLSAQRDVAPLLLHTRMTEEKAWEWPTSFQAAQQQSHSLWTKTPFFRSHFSQLYTQNQMRLQTTGLFESSLGDWPVTEVSRDSLLWHSAFYRTPSTATP